MPTSRRLLKKNSRRIVIKVGSNVIASHRQGLDEKRMKGIAGELSALRDEGHEVLLVSSGSILCGMEKLALPRLPATIPMKQAAAAVGQSRLMWAYEKFFARFNVKVAQILLTADVVADRKRFINARNTLMTLLQYQILPIINENDTVTVDEIKMGDNDHLAAQVTHLVDASLLIILSDVDGLYTEDPRKNTDAVRIPIVETVTAKIKKMAGDAGNSGGTGGMFTKVKTAEKVSDYGVATLILNGTVPGLIKRALHGEEIGTLFLPKLARRSSRKHWIAHALKTKGELMLDQGAVDALLNKGRSLLPSGIHSVRGKFGVGDAILCLSPEGREVAKGLTNYSASEMIRIKGMHSSKIENLLGYKATDEAIHRDNMVIMDDA